MRISQITRRFRDLVEDESAVNWNDQMAARFIDQAIMRMFRWQCELDPSYHNYELDLSGTDSRQLHANDHVWSLPRWVYRVRDVRRQKTSSEEIGNKFFPGEDLIDREGWKLDAAKNLRLRNLKDAPDLTIRVCKMPARVHLGTSAAAGSTTTLVTANHPTPSLTTYDFEEETDAYINSYFELTGPVTTGPDRNPVGQARRCVNSALSQSGTSLRTTITVEDEWDVTPALSDTYEMHPEVDDAHVRLLVLLSAQMAFQRHQNMSGLEAIRGELRDESRRFIDSVSPREDGLPRFYGADLDFDFRRDPDRDFLLGRFGGFN